MHRRFSLPFSRIAPAVVHTLLVSLCLLGYLFFWDSVSRWSAKTALSAQSEAEQIAAPSVRSASLQSTLNSRTFPIAVNSHTSSMDQLLLQLAYYPSASEILELQSLYGLSSLTPLAHSYSNIWVGSVGEGAAKGASMLPTLATSMMENDLVVVAEPEILFSAYATDLVGSTNAGVEAVQTTEPNDSLYNDQWALESIRAAGAWDVTTGNDDITIAVLDSGVEFEHPDLDTNLVDGFDFVENDTQPADDLGHGTHVASVIGSTTNNGIGVAGINWTVNVMPIKVLNSEGVGPVRNIIQGIDWAVEQGADIINLSLGSPDDSRLLRTTVERVIRDHGVVIVAASGNEFEGENRLSYPAAYDEVIAVGSTDMDGNHATFSSSGSHLNLAAPGVQILAATWSGSGGDYAYYSGTSMSAPIVSAVVGLIFSVNDQLSPAEVISILESTAQDVGDPGWDSLTGHGIVDASEAVRSVASAMPTATAIAIPTATPAPTSTPTLAPTATTVPPAPASDPTPYRLFVPLLNN